MGLDHDARERRLADLPRPEEHHRRHLRLAPKCRYSEPAAQNPRHVAQGTLALSCAVIADAPQEPRIVPGMTLAFRW